MNYKAKIQQLLNDFPWEDDRPISGAELVDYMQVWLNQVVQMMANEPEPGDYREDLISFLSGETAILHPSDAERLADGILNELPAPRILVGINGGICQGYSSDRPVNLTVVDHDILQDVDPNADELAVYLDNCTEMESLPYCEYGRKVGR